MSGGSSDFMKSDISNSTTTSFYNPNNQNNHFHQGYSAYSVPDQSHFGYQNVQNVPDQNKGKKAASAVVAFAQMLASKKSSNNHNQNNLCNGTRTKSAACRNSEVYSKFLKYATFSKSNCHAAVDGWWQMINPNHTWFHCY